MPNRAASPNRKKFDQYFTPRWAIEALLESLDLDGTERVLEPCAGAGHIARALYDRGHPVAAFEIDPTVEPVEEDLAIEYGVDFLKESKRAAFSDWLGSPDWVITNPPYSARTGSAAQFFRQAMKIAPRVAMLMRLGWLEACKDREDILPALSRVIIIPRVQFIGSGGTSNSGPSAWCIWEEDRDPAKGTKIEWADRDLIDELKRKYGGA